MPDVVIAQFCFAEYVLTYDIIWVSCKRAGGECVKYYKFAICMSTLIGIISFVIFQAAFITLIPTIIIIHLWKAQLHYCLMISLLIFSFIFL